MMRKHKKNIIRKKFRAETIIEVVVALLVVSMGATTAATLIINSLRATQFNKDSLLALNLAQEGIEYMRNLRDTNWLKFSSNTQGCWDAKPNVSTCTGNLLVPTTTAQYSLGINDSGNYDLLLAAAKLDLSNGVDATDTPFRLNYYDLNKAVNSDGNTVSRVAGLNTSQDDYDFIGSFAPAAPTANLVNNTQFYRPISVSYFTLTSDTPWTATATSDPAAADMMQVTSKVQWIDAGQIHEIPLQSALTRFK